MTALELRNHLLNLSAERAAASLEGLDHDGLYMDDLQDEIESTRQALIRVAVAEIASFRAQLGSPMLG